MLRCRRDERGPVGVCLRGRQVLRQPQDRRAGQVVIAVTERRLEAPQVLVPDPGTGGVGKQENTSMPVIWTGRQTRTRGSRLTITCRPVWYRPQHEPGMAD